MSEKRILETTNYLNIQGWMVTELHLKGSQLLVYAVIYGFSQDGEGWFHGSRSYLAEWCSADLRTVTRILNQLVEDGLVLKDERNEVSGLSNRYKVNRDCLEFLWPAQKETPEKDGMDDSGGVGNIQEEKKTKDIRQFVELSSAPDRSFRGEDILSPPSQGKEKDGFSPLEGETFCPGGSDILSRGEDILSQGKDILPPNNKKHNKVDNKINPSNPFGLQRDLNSVPENGTEANRKENQRQQRDVLPLQTRYELLERVVKGTIRYEDLMIQYPDQVQLLDALVALIVEVRLSGRKKIRVAHEDKDAEVVKGQFAKLAYDNIDQVIQNLEKNTTEIKNIKQYMITSLYNSVFTKDYQSKAEINHLRKKYEEAASE